MDHVTCTDTAGRAADYGIAGVAEVQTNVKPVSSNLNLGDGIIRSAGGWCEHPVLDEVLETIQRQQERRSQTDLK